MAGNVLIPSTNMTPGESSSNQEQEYLSKISGEHDSVVPSHPLGIKPAGNAYSATENIKLATGAFTALPDELIIQVLESLDAASLKRLGHTCKALYAFSRLEELWKTLCIEYEFPLSRFPPPPPIFRCHNLRLGFRGRDLQCLDGLARLLQRKMPTRSGCEITGPRMYIS